MAGFGSISDPRRTLRAVGTAGLSEVYTAIKNKSDPARAIRAQATGGWSEAGNNIVELRRSMPSDVGPGEPYSSLDPYRIGRAASTGGLSEAGNILQQLKKSVGSGGGDDSSSANVFKQEKAPVPGEPPASSARPGEPDYAQFNTPSSFNDAWVNDTSQFDLARNRAAQQSATDLATQRDAMARRFAMLGNLDSGAQFNLNQQASNAAEQNLNSAMEGINSAQTAELGRRKEILQGQQFQQSQQNKDLAAKSWAAKLTEADTADALAHQKWVDKTTADLNVFLANKQDPIEKILGTLFNPGSTAGSILDPVGYVKHANGIKLSGSPQGDQEWGQYVTNYMPGAINIA